MSASTVFKLDSGLWDDPLFRPLSPAAKLVYIYAVSGHMAPRLPGIARLSAEIIVDQLAVSGETEAATEQGFQECLEAGILVQDAEFAVLWAPGRLAFDAPANPNILKRILRDLRFIPDCQTKRAYLAEMEDYVVRRGGEFVDLLRDEMESRARDAADREAVAAGFASGAGDDDGVA